MMALRFALLFLIILLTRTTDAQVGQINISRIEQMPNEPAPYNVRDWRDVAVKYDAFVYDLNKTGQYLPLVYLNDAGVNYPQRQSFGLVTYVGTNSPRNNEAINVLPSLVGASLAGVDKTNQNGLNWILMSQDFFNKNNGQGIYLNNPSTGSGNDWWYDLMPNVYFYQLYDLYPNVGGDADFQFTSIANRFAQAVRGMGGNDAPWQKAYMNYRAWDFAEMKTNASGVTEPEAAGAYAWVLYNAYKKTGNPEYLKAAEWSMEFLNEWNDNPSYELQLPYGTYVAAKMNAELGTNYDIQKMVNWSFDRGALRGWGTIVGKWGGFDVSGLVGEANDNGDDYAFQMNGVQQAAMLAPMVRYDKRFARAIGKWMLNLANATRLFFPGFLPSSLQDASDWSNANDPDRVIGYEALREQWQGKSPFSTGDALRGGWAATNLALYGTSSIGYLGSMLEKTNVDKILRINLLKTDFYRDTAYPTYLLYNPYNLPKTVELAVGDQAVDIYESLSETFISQGVSGTVNITIPADQAVLVVLTPTGGTVSYDRNKMLVNGIVVDYMQSAQPFTYAPRIQALAATQSELELGDSTQVFGTVFDQDSPNLTYSWSVNGGVISGEGSQIVWKSPDTIGEYEITLIVADETGGGDTANLTLKVVAEINRAPQILEIKKSGAYVAPGESLELFCNATDPNGDPLTYSWSAGGGTFAGNGSTVNWTAPDTEGVFQIKVKVEDDKGLSAEAMTNILVKNFTATTGDLIAYYPFSGNANDASGNQLNGIPSGARLTNDLNGNPSSAYLFDGINDYISVANDPKLNFQDAITVSCWFKANQLPDRESFVVSHGSWQNRWKISITPDRKIRWTINSVSMIQDLDSEISIEQDSFYYVTATYDGNLMALYINGELHSYKTMSGKIRTVALPLLLGQMLPSDQNYNFSGVMDEVKIFDYALNPEAVQVLFENSLTTAVQNMENQPITISITPNPVHERLAVQVPELTSTHAWISIYNVNGQLMTTKQAAKAIFFDIKNWIPGFYTIVLKSDEGFGTARFLKQ